jgi:predicted DCC family thiol-disulfide oxidoreductase YuxK
MIWNSLQKPQLLVYYNTQCPVCDAGIKAQKSRLLDAVKAGVIEFRDINLEPDALQHFGADVDDIRRRLHALDAGGRLIVGADVAIAMWRATKGQAWLAGFFGNRFMLPVTRFGYDRFADALFAWNRRSGRF